AAAIFFVGKLFGRDVLGASIAPLVADTLVETFSKGFGEAVGEGFGHDGVVVVVLSAEAVAEGLEADAAGDGEGSDVVGEIRFAGRDEVSERAAGLAAFAVGLLAEEVETREDCRARFVGVELDVVSDGTGGEQSIGSAGGDEILLDDLIEEGVGFGEYLARLRYLALVVEDAGVNAFQFPGVEEGLPVDVLADRGEGKATEDADARKGGRGQA